MKQQRTNSTLQKLRTPTAAQSNAHDGPFAITIASRTRPLPIRAVACGLASGDSSEVQRLFFASFTARLPGGVHLAALRRRCFLDLERLLPGLWHSRFPALVLPTVLGCLLHLVSHPCRGYRRCSLSRSLFKRHWTICSNEYAEFETARRTMPARHDAYSYSRSRPVASSSGPSARAATSAEGCGIGSWVMARWRVQTRFTRKAGVLVGEVDAVVRASCRSKAHSSVARAARSEPCRPKAWARSS